MSQYSHLSIPDEEWLQLATSPPPLPQQPVSIETLRRNFSQIAKSAERWAYPKSGLQVCEELIPVQGTSIRIRIYVPEARNDEHLFPVLVWFHGGGFRIGDLELDDAILRQICSTNRVSCVNVEYRLAPENPFPIPLQDCYDTVKWVATNALSVSADLTKGLLIGGCSTGGNLAAVVTLKARDDPLLKGKITGLILQTPVICPHTVYPEKCKSELLSMEQNKETALLTRNALVDSWGKNVLNSRLTADYGAPDLTSADVAPLLATSHKELPPTYFQICGLDPLRDEAFLYDKILRENEVPTKVAVYSGLQHVFWIVEPLMSSSKRFREDTLDGIKWLLEVKIK
ncbi:hypothetical protein K439DRAFT_1617814 [Ramaria rubella]|nr:hypothetical protein K439DRAFT_1617814 [Ramaria rubella]